MDNFSFSCINNTEENNITGCKVLLYCSSHRNPFFLVQELCHSHLFYLLRVQDIL